LVFVSKIFAFKNSGLGTYCPYFSRPIVFNLLPSLYFLPSTNRLLHNSSFSLKAGGGNPFISAILNLAFSFAFFTFSGLAFTYLSLVFFSAA
jgi:hypothetical protein